jgi:hypothetical protein
MIGKKVASRSTAIGLGVVCIILIAGLGGIVFYYNMQLDTLNNDKAALADYKSKLETWLVGNITQLQSQRDSLQRDYNNYIASHHHTDSEYDALQNQIKITDFTLHTPVYYLFDINKVRFPFTVMIENQGSTDVSGLNLAVKILAEHMIDGGELGRDTSQLSTLSVGHQLTMDMSVLVEINATAGKTLTYVAAIQLGNTTLDESRFTNG